MNCPICFDELLTSSNDDANHVDEDEDLEPYPPKNQTPVVTMCGHIFHDHCISEWFRSPSNARQRTCPTCRKRVRQHDLRHVCLNNRNIAATAPKGNVKNKPNPGHLPAGGVCFSDDHFDKLSQVYLTLKDVYDKKREDLQSTHAANVILRNLKREPERIPTPKNYTDIPAKKQNIYPSKHT
ncbi:ERAD-associated E3 ubiquitin-protein ligase hrd1-like [Folsomia candida]|uniref:ERAD-associated E3 ubiquitin-protein ligase hrd1 n=1 Tax=Folsomia candida TaxID=158441 RepID=A0A226F1U8_FOLCA|nr:ERAD-associated E3 ubiquitin-protein ligase hrd1-like [Folsomia candida]OXA63330.1 ERAD-associated E3 ubiquitin-protein ligase hrd1 [Folsomia candida]